MSFIPKTGRYHSYKKRSSPISVKEKMSHPRKGKICPITEPTAEANPATKSVARTSPVIEQKAQLVPAIVKAIPISIGEARCLVPLISPANLP